jgi:hypothetical protein
MPEMGTSGLMSGDGKRDGAVAPVLAPILDSTGIPCAVVTHCPRQRRHECPAQMLHPVGDTHPPTRDHVSEPRPPSRGHLWV